MTDSAQERSLPVEGVLAEETESSTTDEVISLDDSTEAAPQQTASFSQGTKGLPLCPLPGTCPWHGKQSPANSKLEQRPASSTPIDEAEDQRKPFEGTRTATHTDHEAESGHPCGCPLVPLAATNPVSPPIVFFHEYGRRVGMVPRSSLKEGKYNQMVEKRTKTTQQQTKNPTTNQTKPTTAHRPRLHHQVVFPLY